MKRTIFIAAGALVLAVGCGDDNGNGDDAGRDAGPPMRVEDLPVAEQRTIPTLEQAVEVVIDDRGMPHIYGATDHDVLLVQGYLIARQRLPQMEMLRRGVQGRLAEYAGSLSPALIRQDAAVRVLGFHRQAQAIWEGLPAADDTRAALQAFADGVNLFIEELRAGEAELPRGVREVLAASLFTNWEPVDTLSIARFLTWDLGTHYAEDIGLTEARLGAATAFPAGDSDPRIAARAGLFQDLWGFEPAVEVRTREGFPNVGTDTGTRALQPSRRRSSRTARLPSLELVRRSRRFFDQVRAFGLSFRGEDGGSNNWAVHGSHTASGNPLLASDPHLGFDSPHKFWYAHLNTARAGGNLNVQGLALAGTPGIILGYNEHVAWGATVTNYDVTDVYEETIVPCTSGTGDCVLFDGGQVPIETIREVVRTDLGREVPIVLEVVPHHGILIPEGITESGITPRTSDRALSYRWVGNEPSNEVAAFLGLNRATNVDEVRGALDHFEVGGQNFMVATSEGDIFWSTQLHIPIRDPRALTYDPATGMGYSPCFVLPGTGEYEWTDRLSDRYIPHDINPAQGFLASANADPVGVTFDGNALNDDFYLGCEFDAGYRMGRIDERLRALTAAGGVTADAMSTLQGDHRSPFGARITPFILMALERAEAERDAPGTHEDLRAIVAGSVTAGSFDGLLQARDRLAAWTSFEAASGVGDAVSAQELADSVATSIFNAMLGRLLALTFDDEVELVGAGGGNQAKMLLRALEDPSSLRTYDAGTGDSVIWDDLTTDTVTESRDERIVGAMLGGLAFLTERFGTDMDTWRWGTLHTVRFESLLPALGTDVISIPPPDDPLFPDGFPRPGDNGGVDAANPGTNATTDFSYGNGPQQRFVVEMAPEGPIARNAIPGGQDIDPDGPHHADEADLWRRNEAPPLYFREIDVVGHAEQRLRFTPGNP